MGATPTGSAEGSRPPASAARAWAVLAVGATLAGVLVLTRGSAWSAAPLGLAGLGSTVAILVGRRRAAKATRRPWSYMATATGLFIGGAVLRYAASGTRLAPLAEMLTVAGYAGSLATYAAFLRRRRAMGPSVHELVDGLIVVISCGVLVLVLFTLPTATYTGSLSPTALLLGLYPLADVASLFMLLLLSWTTVRPSFSHRLLSAAIISMLVGDVAYAFLGRRGEIIGSPLLDLPYLVGFCAAAASALHPSMVELSAPQGRTVHAWSVRRLALLVFALLLPAGIVLSGPSPTTAAVGAIDGAVVALLVLARAVGAVRAQAVAQRALAHAAARDPLTGLSNRVDLVHRLERMLEVVAANGGHVDVLFLDIDGFKLVNDSWGHGAGDRFLQSAAHRLGTVTLPTEVVARTGGDEFVVALHVTSDDRRDGETVARRILTAFRKPLVDRDSEHRTTVSVGLARSRPGSTAEALLRDGDTAMYRAKGDGRNRLVVFDDSMRAAVQHRTETELALRDAVALEQLVLEYQPVVRLDDDAVVGVEALVRWRHPTRGLVAPADFIPLAEHSGLVVEIGAWVLDTACAQAAAWAATGYIDEDFHVAVNVSARQLRPCAGFVPLVAETLRRHRLAPAALVVEITESALMDDAEAAMEILVRLKELGVRIAIDDFGTGYSSLAYLQRFPVDRLKVDRSFVSALNDGTNDAIVRSVIQLAEAFGAEAVAEGVETPDQLAALRALGCPLAQGYLWSRPRPPAVLEQQLRDGRAPQRALVGGGAPADRST